MFIRVHAEEHISSDGVESPYFGRTIMLNTEHIVDVQCLQGWVGLSTSEQYKIAERDMKRLMNALVMGDS